jgi:UPF0755 protein
MAKQGKSRFRTVLKVLITLFILMVLAGAGGLYYVYQGLQPLPVGAAIKVEVPAGSGSMRVANILKDSGIIRSRELFTLYLKYKDQGTRFQAGVYEMAPGLTNDQIIAKLNAGDVVAAEMIRFTIPEGFTLKQIAERLGAEGIADADELLALTAAPDKLTLTLPQETVKALPKEKYPLEGYLFPETYEMKKDSTTKEIVERMTNQTMAKVKSIDGWEAKLKERGVTLHELMTVASLVEREAAVDTERALIAGVIYNRLAIAQRLEIDATVQYALGENKERLYEKDLQIDSPYNTYRNDGLPPGPIGSPGLDSIKAALTPEKSDYLFYVTKKDGSREHLFGKTYAEHLKNIAESNKMANP